MTISLTFRMTGHTTTYHQHRSCSAQFGSTYNHELNY